MCGIAGIVRFDQRPIEVPRLEAMRDHLRHRGPDGEGIAAYDRCALVHTRLAIIDLLSGAQPMHVARADSLPQSDGGGPLHLVFNGEIYNHRALRRQLEKIGHRFASDHSDTEVLLLGYRQWGLELPKHLHGMFAFAIWDEDARRLVLVRDRAGKKPLYVMHRPEQGELLFASLAATIHAGVPAAERPGVDRAALLNYLRLGYTFGTSMLAGVEEIPAAHLLVVEPDGAKRLQQYWQPPPISLTSTSLGAVASTREVLIEAVSSRLEADVPLGCFLSGGIDSSVIAALAQRRLLADDREPLRTFSVAMPDLDYDESGYAQQVARAIGAEHMSLQADASHDVIADLTRLVAIAGEPLADSSILPTHWLSRATREHVKVALSGDGGDELFGGYDRYRALWLLQRLRPALRLAPTGMLAAIEPRSKRARLRRLSEAAQHHAPARQYLSMVHLFDDEQIAALGVPTQECWPGGEAGGVPDWPVEAEPVSAARRWDLTHYLPFVLLRKVDRAAMAVALEVRCPMLDTAVCDLAGHLPTSVLMPRGRPKALLRAIAAELLPPQIVRRPKRGFAVPIGRWFAGPLQQPLRDILADGSLDTLGFSRDAVTRLVEDHMQRRADHTHRLFALLDLAIWSRWLRG
jgi:asparagine synthase (glutamine-hydrolysing)